MKVVAVDPGNDAGFAVFDLESGTLEKAGLVRGDPGPEHIPLFPKEDFFFYVERPHPRGANEKMGASSLLKHRDNASKWATVARFAGALEVVEVMPVHWKGSIKKAAFTARLERDLKPFEAEMLAAIKPKSKAHNVLDAVGLGKWAVLKTRMKIRA